MFFVRVWLREVCLFCLDLVLGLGKKDLSSLFYAFGFMFIVYCPSVLAKAKALTYKKKGWDGLLGIKLVAAVAWVSALTIYLLYSGYT